MIRLLILLTFYSELLSGQVSKPNKVQLLDIFRSSIQQDDRKEIQVKSNPWISCNADSAFFKSDTLYFFDNENYFSVQRGCCNFIGWTFYKPTAFIQNELFYCKEPPQAKVVTNKDFYRLSFLQKNKQTFVKVFRKNSFIDTFNVITFDQVFISNGQTSNRLIMVRQKS